MLSFYLLGAKKVFSLLKKVLFVITVYFVIIAFFINFTSKKTQTHQMSLEEKINKINQQFINKQEIKNLPQGKLIVNIYKTSTCSLYGSLCSDNPKNLKNDYEKSFFGKIDQLFASILSIPPASFIYWSYNSLEKTQLIPKSYAAESSAYTGIGLKAIQAFYRLWENMRNLSFLIITLVLVTIGFMIMFRTKINPQTVISIENALPKIVISMILITFSYPIVGLMIDIMYISLPIISGLFNNILDQNTNSFLFDQFINKNVFSVVFDWYFFGKYFLSVGQIISGGFLIQNTVGQILIAIALSTIILFLGAILSDTITNLIDSILGNAMVKLGISAIVQGDISIRIVRMIGFTILAAVSMFIIMIAIIVLGLLFLSFRIFFFLLSCLFNLIVYTVIAPLYLLLEAIPGKSSFSSWIKNIIGNLAVFPAFLFIILLIRALNQSIILEPEKFFSLPGLVSQTDTATFLASMLNIYILLMIPDLLKLVKATIIGKEGLSVPASAGILFGGVGAAGGSIMGLANQFHTLKMGYDAFFGKKQPQGGEQGKITPEENKNVFRERISRLISGKK